MPQLLGTPSRDHPHWAHWFTCSASPLCFSLHCDKLGMLIDSSSLLVGLSPVLRSLHSLTYSVSAKWGSDRISLIRIVWTAAPDNVCKTCNPVPGTIKHSTNISFLFTWKACLQVPLRKTCEKGVSAWVSVIAPKDGSVVQRVAFVFGDRSPLARLFNSIPHF